MILCMAYSDEHLLTAMIDHAVDHQIEASYAELAELANMPPSTVRRAVHRLLIAGEITRYRQAGHTSTYVIISDHNRRAHPGAA